MAERSLHAIHDTLIALGICTQDSLRAYYPRVRDRSDVSVLKCERSGVYVLSSVNHITEATYEDRAGFGYWTASTRDAELQACQDDDRRRTAFVQKWLPCSVLDVGASAGGFLDLIAKRATRVAAVEPMPGPRSMLSGLGYETYARIADTPAETFDVVTAFHSLEHMLDPLEELRGMLRALKPGGSLVAEVPHARDALLQQYDCEAFKAFTFWSEHLVLHTRASLTQLVQMSGFTQATVLGVQRHPLANHLYWLSEGKPGGHVTWNNLRSPDLDRAYTEMLERQDLTDTLIITAQRP